MTTCNAITIAACIVCAFGVTVCLSWLKEFAEWVEWVFEKVE